MSVSVVHVYMTDFTMDYLLASQDDFSTAVVSAQRLAGGVPAGLLIILNQTREAFDA